MTERFRKIGNRIYDVQKALQIADEKSEVDVIAWSGNNRVSSTLDFRKAMEADETQPLIIAHGKVIDGEDRLYKALRMGKKTIPAFILSDQQAFSVMAIKTAVKRIHPDVASEIRTKHKSKEDLSHPYYALEKRKPSGKDRTCRECNNTIEGDAIFFDRATGDEPWLRDKGYICLKHEKDADVEKWIRCPRRECGESVPESGWSEHWRDHSVAASVHRFHTSKVAHCGQCEDDLELEPPVKRRVNTDGTVMAEELSRQSNDLENQRKKREMRETITPENLEAFEAPIPTRDYQYDETPLSPLVTCEDCKDAKDAWDGTTLGACSYCYGLGYQEIIEGDSEEDTTEDGYVECDPCNGTGVCSSCGGNGGIKGAIAYDREEGAEGRRKRLEHNSRFRLAGDLIGPDVFEKKLRKRREMSDGEEGSRFRHPSNPRYLSPDETKQILTETDDEFLERIERNQEEANFYQMNLDMGNVINPPYDHENEPKPGPYDQAEELVFKDGDGPQIHVDFWTGEKKQWHPGIQTRRGQTILQQGLGMPNPKFPEVRGPRVDKFNEALTNPTRNPAVQQQANELSSGLANFLGQPAPSGGANIIQQPAPTMMSGPIRSNGLDPTVSPKDMGGGGKPFSGDMSKPFSTPSKGMAMPTGTGGKFGNRKRTHFHTVTDKTGENYRMVPCGEQYASNFRLASSNKRDIEKLKGLTDKWHDNTTVHAELPEGFHVRRLNTVGDHVVEGTMMNHCLNEGTRGMMGETVPHPITGEPTTFPGAPVIPSDPDFRWSMHELPRMFREQGKMFFGEEEQQIGGQQIPAWRYQGPLFSLRSKENLPKATFFHPLNHQTGEMNMLVAHDIYGVNNKELHPKYRYRMYQYMLDNLNKNTTGADSVTLRWGKNYGGDEQSPDVPEELLTDTEVLSRADLEVKVAEMDRQYKRNETEKTKKTRENERVAHIHGKHGHTYVDETGNNFKTVLCSFGQNTGRTANSLTKQKDERDDLLGQYGDNTTQRHEFSDGYTVRRLNTVGDFLFEGSMSRNCLRQFAQHAIDAQRVPENMSHPFELSHFPYIMGVTDTNDPSQMVVRDRPWRYTGPFHSLRDENGISKATWFHPLDENGEPDSLVAHDVFGINNSSLNNRYRLHMYKYMLHNLDGQTKGNSVTIRWGMTNPTADIQTPEHLITNTEILNRDGLMRRIGEFSEKYAPRKTKKTSAEFIGWNKLFDLDEVKNFWGWKNGARTKRKYRPSQCECWEGYERVPGTKPCAPGSCRKKTGPVEKESAKRPKTLANTARALGRDNARAEMNEWTSSYHMKFNNPPSHVIDGELVPYSEDEIKNVAPPTPDDDLIMRYHSLKTLPDENGVWTPISEESHADAAKMFLYHRIKGLYIGDWDRTIPEDFDEVIGHYKAGFNDAVKSILKKKNFAILDDGRATFRG